VKGGLSWGKVGKQSERWSMGREVKRSSGSEKRNLLQGKRGERRPRGLVMGGGERGKRPDRPEVSKGKVGGSVRGLVKMEPIGSLKVVVHQENMQRDT